MQSVNILGQKTNTKEEESKKSRGNERQQREWERKKNVPSLWQLATVATLRMTS